MRNWRNRIVLLADFLLVPAVYPAALLMRTIRRIGLPRLPISKRILARVGVLPIRDHYYEPQFKFGREANSLSNERFLPGIDWNISGQLAQLSKFTFEHELQTTPLEKTSTLEFYLSNGAFDAGDAEIWYQLIRSTRPKRIIEIGSGNSTLMAIRAIAMNRKDDTLYSCDHTCIEPYEMPWLEEAGVNILRQKVEDVEIEFFSRLEAGDILFIDSSHVIRPLGDVLFEYLQLLPTLKKGVIVHIHDIFSPRNYPRQWLVEDVRLWNEQYLLEAFLTHNKSWKILCAVNYLKHNHFDRLRVAAPFLTVSAEPGSFYIERNT